jgi:hypothetical protein
MQIEALLRADEAAFSARSAANDQVTAFFDTLRREQNRYLDAVGSARGQLGPEHAHLAAASAIQLRLTRRLFDAQRSIVTHRAEIDAELAAIRREVGLPDEAFVAGLPDGGVLERELDSLLDGWWRLEQTDRRVAVAEGGSVDATVRTTATETATAPAPAPVPAPVVPAQAQRGSSELLPSDLLAALDAADPAHLDLLFTSLAEALTTDAVPSPAVVPYTFDDLIIRLEPTDEPTALEALLAPPSTWERVGPPLIDQLHWMLIRVLLPISLVTGSLALAMAWVG